MRTETYTIPEQTVTEEIYEYDELDEDAKETVKEMLSERLQDNDVFWEDIIEELKDTFPNSNLKADYDISYSQGDFFKIYGTISLEDLLNNLKSEGGYLSDSDIKYLQWAFSFGEYGYPSHEISKRDSYDYIDYAYDVENFNLGYYENSGNDKAKQEIAEHGGIREDVFERFDDACAEYLESVSNQFYEEGRDFFSYEVSDEEASDICYGEGYEFDEDGNLTYIDGEEV